MLQGVDTAGPAAIVTAASGVAVSLATIYYNSRRQGQATKEAEERSILRAAELEAEVNRLRSEVERLSRQLAQAEAARIDRDRLMELMQAYGGRRLRRRLLDIDLRR